MKDIELKSKIKIIQSTGTIPLEQVRMLLYAPPKFGKSTFCSGFPDALFLASEKGYGALKVNAIDIVSWLQFKDVSLELRKNKDYRKKYSTLVFDTVDILANLCIEYICEEADIDHISEEKYGKSYDRLKKEFETEINKLFMTDYGLIFTSHTKIVELSSFGGSISKTIPTLNNQARSILIPKIDIIGCMRIKTIKNEEGKYKDIRIVTFMPAETFEAGDRTGRLPNELRVYKDASKTYKNLKDAYEKGREKKGGSID